MIVFQQFLNTYANIPVQAQSIFYLMSMVKLIAFIVVGMIAYYTLGPMLAIALLLLIFVLFIFLSAVLVSDETIAAKAGTKLDKSIAKKIGLATEEHIDILVKNRLCMVSKDAYGVIHEEKWQNECHYFLNKVVTKSLNEEELNRYNFYDNETRAHIGTIVDDIVVVKQQEVEREMEFSDEMDPHHYEQFCALLARKCGWNAITTSGSGDQGADIIARKDGRSVVIQCKKYSKPVGNKAVQEVIAAREFTQTDSAAVVSNSTYTKSAKALAHASQVHLWHHVDLLKMDKNLGLLETDL